MKLTGISLKGKSNVRSQRVHPLKLQKHWENGRESDAAKRASEMGFSV